MKLLIKKSFFMLMILFTHPFSQAKESVRSTDILQLIDQINKSDFGDNKDCLNCSFHDESGRDIFQECAINLCGPPNQHPVFILNNASFENDTNQERSALFKEQAEPLIRKKLEQEKENRSQVIDSLRKALDDPKTGLSSLNNTDLNKLAIRILENGIFEWRQSDNYTPPVEWSVEVSEGDFTVLAQTNLPPDMSLKFKEAIDSYLQERKKEIEHSALTVTGKTPYEDTPVVLEAIWKRFMEQYKTERSKNPDFMRNSYEEIHTIEQEINQLDKAKAFKLTKKVDSLQRQFRKQKQDQHQACEGTQKEICQQIIREYLLKQYQEYQTVNIEESINYCQSQFMLSPPVSQTMQKLQQMWPSIVQRVNKVFTNYSQKSKNQFIDYIQNSLKVNYKETPQKDFLDKIQSFSNREPSPKSLKTYTSKINPENNFIPPAFISADLPSVFNPTDLCSAGLLQNISFFKESIRTADQKKWESIHMSTFSCAFHHYGKQALAHEIGHALSTAFRNGGLSTKSYNQYKQLRECATKQYKIEDTSSQSYQLGKKQTHQNDRFKTEEDTADLISYIIFNDESVLRSCHLLKPTKGGLKYTLEIFHTNEEDPHSTPFLRLLTEAIHKQKDLPRACQQVIDRYKDRVNFEPCF